MSFKHRNIFDVKYLCDILQKHINNEKDYTRELRAIVNLEIWFREFEK